MPSEAFSMYEFENRRDGNPFISPAESQPVEAVPFGTHKTVYGPVYSPFAVLNRRVNIFSSLDATTQEGEPVLLWCELIGFDNSYLALQWQYDMGAGWKDIQEGGNGLSYTYIATKHLLECSWRLVVRICG